MIDKNTKKQRKLRISANLRGTKEKPRLSVFRSNQSMYIQLIDDFTGKTILGLSDKSIDKKNKTKTERAKELGVALADKAREKKIKNIVFDKGSYKYHGRVKAVADGAREGGLQF